MEAGVDTTRSVGKLAGQIKQKAKSKKEREKKKRRRKRIAEKRMWAWGERRQGGVEG